MSNVQGPYQTQLHCLGSSFGSSQVMQVLSNWLSSELLKSFHYKFAREKYTAHKQYKFDGKSIGERIYSYASGSSSNILKVAYTII